MLSFIRRNGLPAFLHCGRRLLLADLFSSSSAATAVGGGRPSPNLQLLVEYLADTLGFSAVEASKASKPLAHLKSMKKPDAVLSFLRSNGFDDSHLQKMVSSHPRLLCCNVEKTLAPKFQSLRDLGFSDSDLIEIIVDTPLLKLSLHRSILPRLEMWQKLFGSRELLIKLLKKKSRILCYNLQKTLLPNMSFLRDECGIPDQITYRLARWHPYFILRNPESLRASVIQAEELGMPRQSRMLLYALVVLLDNSKESLEAKIKLMTSLWWSESEFSFAFRKDPTFLRLSEKELQRKMEFFIKEAGRTPSYIASNPKILKYSFKKRVIPRYRVMEILKSKGLYSGSYSLLSILGLSEEKFMQKFVLSYKEKVPELLDIFAAEKDNPYSFL